MPVVSQYYSDKAATWSSVLLLKVCKLDPVQTGTNQNVSSFVNITADLNILLTVLLEYFNIDTKCELICYYFFAFHAFSYKIYILLCLHLANGFIYKLHTL